MNGLGVPQWSAVGVSVALVALAVAVAVRQRLALVRDLLLAAGRAAVQLLAIGAVFALILHHAGILGALGWVALMVLVAGQVAGRRGRGLPHARLVATLAIAAGTAVTVGLLIACQVVASDARVVIPIGAMVVAGATQAVALALTRLAEQARSARAVIEARLCLGLPAEEAFRPHARLALRTALMPPIDSTKIVGLIALPGAMTGLLLAGVAPMTAVRYQLIVMYMLLAAAAVAALAAVWLGRRALFDSAHRLRPPVRVRSAAASRRAKAKLPARLIPLRGRITLRTR